MNVVTLHFIVPVGGKIPHANGTGITGLFLRGFSKALTKPVTFQYSKYLWSDETMHLGEIDFLFL